MKFAIIGAGAIAGLRKAAIDSIAGSEVTGVFDLNEARAKDLAGSARVYKGLDDVLADDRVETVIICTPPDTHEEIAVAALESGRHVIVEKPMAPSTEACKRMIAAAQAADRVLTVGFNHRYFPAIKELRASITSGRLGDLSHVRGYAGHAGLAEFKAEWMYDKDVMGGGALYDNGIHMIDLVHHLMGPVEDVYGLTQNRTWQLDRVEDNGMALLRGRDGTVGSIGASWTEWKGYHFYVEAYGTKGMARAYYAPMTFMEVTMDRPGGPSKKRRNFYLPQIFAEKFKGWQSTAVQTLVEEITDFMALCAGRAAPGPIASSSDGLAAIAIAQAVYASAESGQRVALEAAP
jgi:predicted dehydrogenase